MADAQQGCGPGSVAIGGSKCPDDELGLECDSGRLECEIFAALGGRGTVVLDNALRQVGEGDFPILGENNRALDGILKFSNVAWPRIIA